MTDYLELAKDITKKAQINGNQAEAFIVDSYETSILVDKGEVEQLSQSGSKGLGVRVIDGGKVGYAYTSNFSADSIEATIQAAQELCQVATPDENRALPELREIPDEDLEIYDPELANVSTADKIELARKAEKAALESDSRMFLAMSNYGDYVSHYYLVNSNGFAGQYSRTGAYSYIDGYARENDDTSNGFGLSVSNFYNELDPVAIGKDAAYKTTLTLGPVPVPTQVATVVFDPFIFAQVLMYLSMALNAESMQRGRSFLIGKMGQEVGSDKLTLLDNPRMKRGFNSAPFDGEGVPTSATRLIDEGVLQNIIYDTYTARQADATSTGNAQRGDHRSLPNLGPSNFYIQPGHKSQEEILKGVDKGLYVTRIMQTGGINPVNGDCSMSATGVWIENGEFKYPVNGVTIATTLPDLLKNVSEVGSDLMIVPFMGSIGSPTVRIEKMTIGGTSENA